MEDSEWSCVDSEEGAAEEGGAKLERKPHQWTVEDEFMYTTRLCKIQRDVNEMAEEVNKYCSYGPHPRVYGPMQHILRLLDQLVVFLGEHANNTDVPPQEHIGCLHNTIDVCRAAVIEHASEVIKLADKHKDFAVEATLVKSIVNRLRDNIHTKCAKITRCKDAYNRDGFM